MSDLHLGPGWLPNGQLDPLEDFTAGTEFARFLDRIGSGRDPVELVIAGDFLEYCQTLPEIGLASPEDGLGSTQAESIQRTRVIMGQEPRRSTGHPEVFDGLRRFMSEGNSVTIIAGNHDIDMLWPGVWVQLFDAIYPPGAWGDLRRVAYSYTVGRGQQGRVHIEHGHEHDKANRFGDRMAQPFGLDQFGVRRLKRCWGTLFVDKVYNQLEQERWFIDNVKPILRVVKLGLRNDFIFTATAIGLVVRFLITSGLPPLLGASPDDDLGLSDDAALELLPSLIDDPDLRAAVEAQLSNPERRAQLAAALHGDGDLPMGLMLGGAAAGLQLDDPDDLITSPDGGVILGGAMAEDTYRQAARAVLAADPSITTVVMGHTHGSIDGTENPLQLPDGRTGYYFNTGTWTRHLRDEGRRAYSWNEIRDERNYTASLSYVRLDPDGKGGYHPTLGSWQADCQR
ncbi:MAG: hypothetical protein AB4911_00800 [Oscillochloridaceae bacterium umkhey_bin13]